MDADMKKRTERARRAAKESARRRREPDRIRELARRSRWKREGYPDPTRPRPELCELCGGRPNGQGNTLHLDHDHRTGRFRGWICTNCNVGLGMLGDHQDGLRQALHYLNRPIAVTDPADRKAIPLFTGLMQYFPQALMAVANVSWRGNQQHHPGQPLHWDRSKSADESDALLRHLADAGTRDTDGARNTAKAAWRVLAMLQKEIEKDGAL